MILCTGMDSTQALHTILLVEDEAIIAMAQATTLKRQGFNVITAYNGKDAIARAETNPELDLILMDIDLGAGMDGTEAAQMILQRRDIPILFLSSHTERDVVEKSEKITSYGYVVKNTGETVLVASIKMAYKLFASEQKYRFLFEHSPLGIIQFNQQGIITGCNETYERYLGVKRTQLIGLDLLILPDKTLVEGIKKALRGELGIFEGVYESTLTRRSLRVRGFFAPFRSSNRELAGGIGLFEDVSQRYDAEQAKERSMQLFTTLINNMQGGVLVESADRIITHSNQAFCDIFGIPGPDALAGASCEASARMASSLFKEPQRFLDDIESSLLQGVVVVGHRLQLNDGRVLERDYIPVTTKDTCAGNMWVYRLVTP